MAGMGSVHRKLRTSGLRPREYESIINGRRCILRRPYNAVSEIVIYGSVSLYACEKGHNRRSKWFNERLALHKYPPIV